MRNAAITKQRNDLSSALAGHGWRVASVVGSSIGLALALAAVCVAQDDDSVRQFGIVRDANGEPWAGARVRFHSRPIRNIEWVGHAHSVTVVSDARGRFAAELIAGRRYLVWAVSEPEDGIYRTSAPVQIGAGRPVRLREAGKRAVTRVTIETGRDWKDAGPFTGKVTHGADHLRDFEIFTTKPVGPTAFELPQLPWRACSVEVYDKRGACLATKEIELARSPGPVSIRLPERVARRIAIEGPDGKPVAGVELVQRVRGRMVPITRSDASGSIVLPFATLEGRNMFKPLGPSSFAIRARGCALIPPVDRELARNPLAAARWAPKPKPVVALKAERKVHGKLLLGDRALANADVILVQDWSRSFAGYRNFSGISSGLRMATTDASGAFSFSHCSDAPWRAYAILPDAARRSLARASVEPVPFVLLAQEVFPALKPTDLGTLRLDRMRTVLVEAKAPDGKPAEGIALWLFRRSRNNDADPYVDPLVTPCLDRRGRCLLITAEQGLDVAVNDEANVAWAPLDSADEHGTLSLGLRAVRTVSGTVQDVDGRPVEGAIIYADAVSSGSRIASVADENWARTGPDGRFHVWALGNENSVELAVLLGRKRQVERVDLSHGSVDDVRIVRK